MIEVRRLTAPDARQSLDALAEVLADCVQGGASVSFMAPFPKSAAAAFFETLLPEIQRGDRILLAAYEASKLVGTVQVLIDTPPNQPHRGDVAKLLVLRSARGQGVAKLLMQHAEEFARGDPFVLDGMVSKWDIREWANMFA